MKTWQQRAAKVARANRADEGRDAPQNRHDPNELRVHGEEGPKRPEEAGELGKESHDAPEDDAEAVDGGEEAKQP